MTPAHFLIGESIASLPEPEPLEHQRINGLRRWEMVQRFNQEIWRKWHNEYLVTLINRTKWKMQTRNFKINDLVLIKEDNMPPSKWHMGRIMEVMPSKDGIVRAAKVYTLTGSYLRPILKLALLLPAPEDTSTSDVSPLRPITEQMNTNLSKLYDKLIDRSKRKPIIKL